MGASALGGVLSSYATFSKAINESQDAEYAANASERNAQMLGAAAGSALDQGVAQQAASKMKYAATLGEQKSLLGASGVSVDSGSALDILAGTSALGEYDTAVLRDNAAREAWALQQQQKEARLQSMLLKQKSGKALESGTLSTIGSLASTAAGGGR